MEFFNSFHLTDTNDDLVGHVNIGGRALSFTYRELGLILNIPSTRTSFYTKNSWPPRVNREEIVTKVTGYSNLSAPTTAKHDKMSVLNKILAMISLNNLVPRKEGRVKTVIQDYLLIYSMLTNEKISLPKLILLHLQHARATEHHGTPYGGLIHRILEYLGAYTEGIHITTLGKPLDMRCLKLAFFSYYEGN